jgi:hypothetical protein
MSTEDVIRETNAIADGIESWAKSNGAKIVQAYNMKGGWEGWAQVELAIALSRNHGWNYGSFQQNVISREDHVYDGTKQESDIMLSNKLGTNIIELKCESSYDSKNFAANVLTDLKKVANGEIASKYLPATVWVVGISVSQEVHVAMKKITPALKLFQPFGETSPVSIWYWKTVVYPK